MALRLALSRLKLAWACVVAVVIAVVYFVYFQP